MKKAHLMILLMTLCTTFTYAQVVKDTVKEQYIAKYKDLAMNEMRLFKIPASIKLAKGLHETAAGTSDLFKRSNNHFGIKCKESWTSPCTPHTDDAKDEPFRVYKTAEESYRDHSLFLQRKRYEPLFKLDIYDYQAWARVLKESGYATDSEYSKKLVKLIKDYNLEKYDTEAMQQQYSSK